MRLFRLLLMVVVLLFMSVLGFLMLGTPAAHAANPPTDAPCRSCHNDTERQHTFPSGESMSLRVDLSQINGSVHSSLASEAVACTSCHVNETRYRYPHSKQIAESKQILSQPLKITARAATIHTNPSTNWSRLTQFLLRQV